VPGGILAADARVLRLEGGWDLPHGGKQPEHRSMSPSCSGPVTVPDHAPDVVSGLLQNLPHERLRDWPALAREPGCRVPSVRDPRTQFSAILRGLLPLPRRLGPNPAGLRDTTAGLVSMTQRVREAVT
jgi:hypothetical protein